MNGVYEDKLTQPEVAAQLQAAVAARHEMGPDMEEQVLEVFLARVQGRIDAQVAEQMARRSGAQPLKRERVESAPLVMAGSLGVAIPLMAIAAEAAQGLGIFLVMAGVVIINTLYFVDRWVRFNTR